MQWRLRGSLTSNQPPAKSSEDSDGPAKKKAAKAAELECLVIRAGLGTREAWSSLKSAAVGLFTFRAFEPSACDRQARLSKPRRDRCDAAGRCLGLGKAL